jgi:hypothetical protein
MPARSPSTPRFLSPTWMVTTSRQTPASRWENVTEPTAIIDDFPGLPPILRRANEIIELPAAEVAV